MAAFERQTVANGDDKIEREIKEWIQQAEAPKDKALLMILFQMNSNLIENTVVTKAVASEFTTHKNKVDGLLNRLRGGWLVLGFSFLIVQAMGIWIVNTQLSTISREVDHNASQDLAIERIQSDHRNLERRLGIIEDKLNKQF